jgi:hypothetical protein
MSPPSRALPAGSFSPRDLDSLLGAFPEVIDYVERDATISITGEAAPEWAASDSTPAEAPSEDRDLRQRVLEQARGELRRRKLPEQLDPAWNLDRVDQKSYRLDRKYHYDTTGVEAWLKGTEKSTPAGCQLAPASI